MHQNSKNLSPDQTLPFTQLVFGHESVCLRVFGLVFRASAAQNKSCEAGKRLHFTFNSDVGSRAQSTKISEHRSNGKKDAFCILYQNSTQPSNLKICNCAHFFALYWCSLDRVLQTAYTAKLAWATSESNVSNVWVIVQLYTWIFNLYLHWFLWVLHQ